MDAVEREPLAETKDSNVREACPEIVEDKETVFDMSTEENELLDYDSARELFRPLEETGKSYTKIVFGNKSFGVDAAHVAKIALQAVRKTLKDVELFRFYFERSEAEALEVVRIISSALEGCVLRSLCIALVRLGEKGIYTCGPLLKSQKMLEELGFWSTAISVQSATDICEFFPSVKTIKHLHFCNNVLGDDAAERLSVLVEKCIALESFDFFGSWVGSRGAKALARALSQSSGLKKLDLHKNMFGPIGGVALSEVIPNHLSLTDVIFDSMHLEDEGAIAIADSLKDAAPSLRVFSVGGNYITSKAAPALAKCLSVKNLLTIFNAADNILRDDGSVVICRAISEGHEQLKELDLSDNGMTVTGAKAAAEAVANKPDFSRLDLDFNPIDAKGVESIHDVLRKGIKGDSVLATMISWNSYRNPYSNSEFKEKLIKLKVRHPEKSNVEHDSDKSRVTYGIMTDYGDLRCPQSQSETRQASPQL